MKDRSVPLTGQQRSALILCDGKRSAQEILTMTHAAGVSEDDLQALVDLGLIEPMQSPISASNTAQPSNATASTSPSAASDDNGVDFTTALSAAITLCADLGFKGFSLNMALSNVDSLEKLQALAPKIRDAAGEAKYKPLHAMIFGEP